MPELIQPNALHQYTVTEADVPLSCPMPGMYLWNSHPKVYFAIEAERLGQVLLLRRREYTLPRG